tara:strand:- start:78 stop:326 length:249 start_codon:yes stop_codon:yes gene_type:complete
MHMSERDMRISLQSMTRIQREAGSTISRILDGAVPEEYIGYAKLGPSEWGCARSTVGLCVYDSIEDRAMDECIFCGEPEERK